jgi:subtilisin family serine protease
MRLDQVTLRYGRDRSLTLYKSFWWLGLKPAPDSLEVLLSIVPWIRPETIRTVGGFRVFEAKGGPLAPEDLLDEARTDPRVLAATHVYYTSDDGVAFVPTGELFLRFDRAVSEAARDDLLRQRGLELVEVRGVHDAIAVVTERSANPVKMAKLLQESDSASIVVAEPLFGGEPHPAADPTDPLFPTQWHLKNTGNNVSWPPQFLAEDADARVLSAWKASGEQGRPEVVIAVIDDGFDLDHDDLPSRQEVRDARDFGRGGNDPRPTGRSNHGTACAGLIAAKANGTGVVGVAPGCSLMPIRWNPRWSDRDLEEWFLYVRDKQADVLSCSWTSAARVFELSTMVDEAITSCAQTGGRNGKGCVICFAAGNAGVKINDPGRSVNGFAIHPDVLAVAALDSLDKRSSASNFGAEIDVCAPTGGPDGLDLVTTTLTGQGLGDSDYTREFGKTSGATAIVAGVCGLVKSVAPGLGAGDVREIIRTSARRVDDLLMTTAPRTDHVGHGCVQADKAVACAISWPTPCPGG